MTPNWLGFLKGSKDDRSQRSGRGKLVYALDDDGEIRELLKEILEGAGYRVELFWSGPELLESLDDQVPDVILLDINMPIVSGWDVRKQLARRDAGQQIPVIAVTGTTARNAERYAREELGFTDFLRKPFGPDELLESIQQALANRPEPQRSTPSPEATATSEGAAQPDAASTTQPATGRTEQPADTDGVQAAEIEELEPEPVDAPTGERILVATSDETVRKVAAHALESRGYGVDTYTDGDALSARLVQDPPELLVLDLMMAGPDGAPVARRIAQDPTMADVPIIAIQRIQSEAAAKLIKWVLGLEGCLVAPFDGGDVAQRVATVLERQRANPTGRDPDGPAHA